MMISSRTFGFFLAFAITLPMCTFAQILNPGNFVDTAQAIPLTWERIVGGMVLLILGLCLVFTGYRHYRLNIFIAGFTLGAIIVFSIILNVQPSEGWDNNSIIFVFAPIGGGLVVGILTWILHRIAAFVLYGMAGLSIALYVLAWRDNTLVHDYAARVGIMCGASAVGIIIGLFAGRRLTIPATAILGGYVSVLGIDLIARTGFSYSIRYCLQKDPKYDYTITTLVYIMLGIAGGLMVLGMIFQALAWNARQKRLRAAGSAVHNHANDWSIYKKKQPIATDAYATGAYNANYDHTYNGATSTSNNGGYDDTGAVYNSPYDYEAAGVSNPEMREPVASTKKGWQFWKNGQNTQDLKSGEVPVTTPAADASNMAVANDPRMSYSSNVPFVSQGAPSTTATTAAGGY